MDEETSKINSLINIGAGKLLPQIYEDLAKPSVVKIGKALETVLDLSNTILLPLKLINERSKFLFQKNLQNYEERLIEIEIEKIIEVPPEIGIPVLDKLTYIENETLSKLFTNFLANASNSDKVELAHPSFVNILSNISIDEASIMMYFSIHYNMEDSLVMIPSIDISMHIYDKIKNKNGIYLFGQRITPIGIELELAFPKNINIYQDNLVKLGILEYSDSSISSESYDDLIYAHQSYINDLKKKVEIDTDDKEIEIKIKKTFFKITDYGKLFFKACDLNKLGSELLGSKLKTTNS